MGNRIKGEDINIPHPTHTKNAVIYKDSGDYINGYLLWDIPQSSIL